MAITDDAVAAAKRRIDPMEELAKQFKEARGMLDELPVAAASDAHDALVSEGVQPHAGAVEDALGENAASTEIPTSGSSAQPRTLF